MGYLFQEKTWPELKEYIDKNALIILPVGEMEEHSLWLPVDTDARIAEYLTGQLAAHLEEEGEIPVLVMPAIWSRYTPKAVPAVAWRHGAPPAGLYRDGPLTSAPPSPAWASPSCSCSTATASTARC